MTQALQDAGFIDLTVHDISQAVIVVARTPDVVLPNASQPADASVV